MLVRPGSGFTEVDSQVLRPITTGLPIVSARKCCMSDFSRHGITPPRPITPFSATAAMMTICRHARSASRASAAPLTRTPVHSSSISAPSDL